MRRFALAALAVLLVLPAAASARVPKGFLGTNLNISLVTRHANLGREIALMRRAGVQTLRVVAYWDTMQPYRTWADVPAAQRSHFRDEGGAPTDFRALDHVIGLAARQHIAAYVASLRAPRWASFGQGGTIPAPNDPADYGRFVAALARRYGPAGSFWKDNPKTPRLPIRQWQVWNEPNNPYYWADGSVKRYVALMRTARTAVRKVDGEAKIITGGITNRSWEYLAQMEDADARGAFDILALHPYTSSVSDALKVLQLNRQALASHHDAGKSIRVTEVGWPSGQGKLRKNAAAYFTCTTDKGQAQRATQVYKLLPAHRGALKLVGMDWYTWASDDLGRGDAFRYAGLRRVGAHSASDKPAMAAFKAALKRLER